MRSPARAPISPWAAGFSDKRRTCRRCGTCCSRPRLRSPTVALLSLFVATAGLYFVWFPAHSTWLAELVGIGRGVDLILYTWVCISLLVLLNLHLKLRTQMELITTLARKAAIAGTIPI